jgi:hypothetical protein
MALSKTNVAARMLNLGNIVVSCPKCDKDMKETYISAGGKSNMFYSCGCGERIKILKGQKVYKGYKHRYL